MNLDIDEAKPPVSYRQIGRPLRDDEIPRGWKVFEVTDDNGHVMWRGWDPPPGTDKAPRADYGKNWPAVRDAIVLRDGGACRDCGATEKLHVHHIVTLLSFDGDTDAANVASNLITLCHPCHMFRHGRTVRLGGRQR